MAGHVDVEASAATSALIEVASCAICGGLFDCPLLLRGCGHSFCSRCIRENLEFQERSGPPACPSCRKACDARDLLPNLALREVVDKLAAASPLITSLIQRQQQAAAAETQQRDAAPHLAPKRLSGKRSRSDQAQQQQAAGTRRGSGTAADVTRRRTRSAPADGGSIEEINLAGDTSSDSAGTDGSTSSSGSDGANSDADWQPKKRRGTAGRSRSREAAAPLQQQQQQQRRSSGAEEPLPAGFVRCPVCNKTVPSFYINSHVDQCLAGGGEPAAGAGAAQQQQQQQQQRRGAPPAGPFEPLAVPAKLVPNLASEKSLRQLLKRYSLPTDGKKKELLERYSRLRLAVEMANDKQECTNYARLASRVMQQERSKAAAHLLLPPAAGKRLLAAGAPAATAAEVEVQPALRGVAAAGAASSGSPATSSLGQAPVTLFGMGFKQLIAVTRARDAVRRAARAAHEQQQRKQEVEEEAEAEDGQQEVQSQPQQEAPQQQPEQANDSLGLGSEDDDESARLWDEELPLSQSQEAEWQQRQQHHEARRRRQEQRQQQQEQRPPNHRLAQSSVICLPPETAEPLQDVL